MTDLTDARYFLATIFEQRSGYVALARGSKPYRDANGRYKHHDWIDNRSTRYLWPDLGDRIIADVHSVMATGVPTDWYICPVLRRTPGRNKGNAASLAVCWADLDNEPADPQLCTALDPLVVNSGTPGHRHAYLPLTEPVGPALHEKLNRALATRLGGDAKWADNSVLRLPGTYNFKPTVPLNGHAPAPPALVTIEPGWSGIRCTPAQLAALLRVDPSGAPADHGAGEVVEGEQVEWDDLPESIVERLAEKQLDDRSTAFHGLVGECLRAGYTQGQTVTIAASWPPARDKYDDRLASEVARSWEKIQAEKQAPETRKKLTISSNARAAEWLRKNIGRGPLSGMFNRTGDIVYTPAEGEDGYIPLTDDGADGPAQVRPVTANSLAARIQYTYNCYRRNKDGTNLCLFPLAAAKIPVEVPDMLPKLRALRGVVHSPMLRADGSILAEPGYDPTTRLLYLPEPGLVVPTIPEYPSREDVTRAVAQLDFMIAQFPFVTDDHKANYLGMLLTPLLREIAPPAYKMLVITAPQPGSGKSLLAYILRTVHGGVFRSEVPGDNVEFSKQISTILDVTTGPVVQFDNVSGVLRSSVLSGLLTSNRWDDRRLGSNTMISRPNDRLWVITGNNVAIGGDLPRRTVSVSIDAKVPDPQRRTGFAIPNLEYWVRDHRGELIAALLILIRWWVVHDRPIRPRGSDSFARWIQTVDGILASAGVPGMFDAPDTALHAVGADDEEWAEFLRAVHAEFGSTTWTVRKLLDRVETAPTSTTSAPVHFAGAAPPKPIPLDSLPSELVERVARARGDVSVISKSLGRWLANRDGRWAGGLTVRSAGQDPTNVKLWRIQTPGGG